MADLIVKVCDVCGRSSVPAQTYTITREDEGESSMDLCAQHARPIERVIDQATGKLPAPKAPGRRSQMKVVSMEDIEALKDDESAPPAKS